MKTPKIINAINFVDDDLISAANDQKAKPFYIKPVFKRATAIAACLAIVAVTAFALTNKTNNNISSNNSGNDNSNASNQNGGSGSNNSSDISQNDNVGTSPSFSYISDDAKPISDELQEKMDLYKNTGVVYHVIVEIRPLNKEAAEASEMADDNEEVKLLYDQHRAAREEEDKAEIDLVMFNRANPGNEPEIVEKRKELIAIYDEKREIRIKVNSARINLRHKLIKEYLKNIVDERLQYATEFSENTPTLIAKYEYNYKYYIDLTAEEINILAEKGGYLFKLAPSSSNNQKETSEDIVFTENC